MLSVTGAEGVDPRQCPDRGFRQHSATGNGQPGFRDSERRHRHRGHEPARSGQEPDTGADGRTAASLRLLGISAPNLDIIPSQLIERVDILTGGASAVYGSDAVGGVANFILKRDFEGVEIGIQRGNSYSSNDNGFWRTFSRRAVSRCPAAAGTGKRTLIYTILGGNLDGGRGNVTVFASYEDREEIRQADRMVSGCALGQNSGTQSFGGFGCIGSSNFRAFNGGSNNPLPPIGTHFQQEDGTMIPFVSSPSTTYNFGPNNFFQRPSERWTIYGKGHIDVSDNIEAFMDLSYTNNISDAQIAPTASFGGNYSINCDNPFLQGNPAYHLPTSSVVTLPLLQPARSLPAIECRTATSKVARVVPSGRTLPARSRRT